MNNFVQLDPVYSDGTIVQETIDIQMHSLVSVMYEFGYQLIPGSSSFFNVRENKIISFKTAVELHNALEDLAFDINFTEHDGVYTHKHFTFTSYQFYRAIAAQVVTRVKLQVNKRKKFVICQSNKVTFVVENYKHIFLQNAVNS